MNVKCSNWNPLAASVTSRLMKPSKAFLKIWDSVIPSRLSQIIKRWIARNLHNWYLRSVQFPHCNPQRRRHTVHCFVRSSWFLCGLFHYVCMSLVMPPEQIMAPVCFGSVRQKCLDEQKRRRLRATKKISTFIGTFVVCFTPYVITRWAEICNCTYETLCVRCSSSCAFFENKNIDHRTAVEFCIIVSLPSNEIYYLPCVTLPGLTSLFDRGILAFHLPLSWLLTLIILVFRLETEWFSVLSCYLPFWTLWTACLCP